MLNKKIDKKKLYFKLLKEEKKEFKGWDFSYLSKTGRVQDEPLDWSYGSIVLKWIEDTKNILDMGTGGGEVLERLTPLPENTYATEGYKKNFKIAKKRLSKLGVKVKYIESDENLPFKDKFFDLIINRHESFDFNEIRRIIKEKGIFITQQVGFNNCLELNRLLEYNKLENDYWNLEYTVKNLEEKDFNIIYKNESFPKIKFYDIGAIVYFLKVIPWQIPDFTVEKYFENLFKLAKIIEKQGSLTVSQHRFIVVAGKE